MSEPSVSRDVSPQMPPVSAATIVSATTTEATVTIALFGDAPIGPYPIIRGLTTQSAGDPSHTHSLTAPEGDAVLIAANFETAWVLVP